MREVELYNAYRTASIILYIAGALLLCTAIYLLVRSMGGIREIKNRLTPNPMTKQEKEEEQKHIQKVAEALQQGKVAPVQELGLTATEKLMNQEDTSGMAVTTVLSSSPMEAKFRIVRKLIITHER